MSRTPLIAGNWKMNKTVSEALELISGIKQGLARAPGVDILVCPPYTALATAVEATAGSPIAVGAQSVHWEESGAFTGEIAASMLTELGVKYAIIGHSERRQYFGETDASVNQRLKATLSAWLTPVVCIGETLAQREQGDTEAVVSGQIQGGFEGLTPEQMQRTVVAYEPIWAIGTGLTATPKQAQDVHAFVRSRLRSAFGDVADSVRVLYGGSVKPASTAALMAQPDIDGALVGGASLKAEDFLGIITQAA